MFTACTKDGKQGAQGIAGKDGTNGTNGKDANETCKLCHSRQVVDSVAIQFELAKHQALQLFEENMEQSISLLKSWLKQEA